MYFRQLLRNLDSLSRKPSLRMVYSYFLVFMFAMFLNNFFCKSEFFLWVRTKFILNRTVLPEIFHHYQINQNNPNFILFSYKLILCHLRNNLFDIIRQMQLADPEQQPAPLDFLKQIQQYSFQERFFKWEDYIRQLAQQQSPYYETALEMFVEHYPFNHTYWLKLIEHILTKPKSKAAAVKMYQIALAKNSRCVTLWQNYLNWLKEKISKSDPNYLRGEYQKATKVIGTHYHAAFVFEQYFELQTDLMKKYQAMKKALVSPLKEIDRVYDRIASFVEESTQLTVQILENIAKNQQISTNEPRNSPQYLSSLKEKLKQMLRKLYQPTKKHVELRFQFQQKLTFDEYRPFEGSIEVWKRYLYFIKNSGNFQFVYPLYERALIFLCDKESLWQEYFLILESEGNYNRALYLLRSHATFFESLSRQLTYYWLQIEERESPARTRQLYIELEKKEYQLEAFVRHLQLELRAKEFQNAKVLYETMLTVFSANVEIIAYIVVEYAEFTIKYFRDVEFAKKLLQNYFQSSPYNQYLFLNYLEFFIKHVEYKENSKDSKEVYDSFVQVICTGLERAYENTFQNYGTMEKIVQKYLRDYVNSIYLLKAAERKIKQMEFRCKNQKLNSLKRPYEQVDQIVEA